jgi:hypothetical protein
MRDRRGCPVSTASDAAQEHVEQALWRLSSFYGDPLGDLEAASAADPGWMLPHVMRAGFLLTLTERHLLAAAAEALDAAARCHGNERERAHLAAAQRALAGDWLGACERWEGLLLDHPRDVLALQLAHLFDFYCGDARELRLRVARVLPEWPRDDGLYPYVLGMYAFGLEENHLYPQAEAVGREALDGGARVAVTTRGAPGCGRSGATGRKTTTACAATTPGTSRFSIWKRWIWLARCRSTIAKWRR